MPCKYVKQDGSRCNREVHPNSEKGYCILHEDWDHKEEEETKKRFFREIEEGITDFEGCILADIILLHLRMQRSTTCQGKKRLVERHEKHKKEWGIEY